MGVAGFRASSDIDVLPLWDYFEVVGAAMQHITKDPEKAHFASCNVCMYLRVVELFLVSEIGVKYLLVFKLVPLR